MHHYLYFTSLVKNGGGGEDYCPFLRDWKLLTKVVFDEGFAVIGEKKKKNIFRLFCTHIHVQSTHNAINGTKVIRNESLQLSRYKKPTLWLLCTYTYTHAVHTILLMASKNYPQSKDQNVITEGCAPISPAHTPCCNAHLQ